MIKFLALLSITAISVPVLAADDHYYPGFEKIPAGYSTERGSLITTKHIPPVRDQHYLGMCSAFAAASFVDSVNCIDNQIVDCSKLPLSKMASVLDLARRNKYKDEIDAIRKRPDFPKDPQDSDFYRGLEVSGLSARVIFGESVSVYPESMMSYEKIFGGVDGKRTVAEGLLAMKTLNNFYEETKKLNEAGKTEDAGDYVIKNFPKIKSLFNYLTGDNTIRAAFFEDNINLFYDKIFIPKYATPKTDAEADRYFDLQVQIPFIIGNLNHYPARIIDETDEDLKRTGNYADAIKNIKEAVQSGSTVILSGICAAVDMPAKLDECYSPENKKIIKERKQNPSKKYPKDNSDLQLEKHILLVTGYKRVCNAANDCFDAIRLLNSWGASWQNEFTHEGLDGWVKAKTTLDRTFYNAHMMTWYDI